MLSVSLRDFTRDLYARRHAEQGPRAAMGGWFAVERPAATPRAGVKRSWKEVQRIRQVRPRAAPPPRRAAPALLLRVPRVRRRRPGQGAQRRSGRCGCCPPPPPSLLLPLPVSLLYTHSLPP